jgi:hypothetical protein
MSEMPTNRSSTSARSRPWLRGFTRVSSTGAARLIREILERSGAGVVGALIMSAALSLFLTGCGHHPKTAVRGEHGMFVMDDFGSGAVTDWRAVGGGSGVGSSTPTAARRPIPVVAIPTFPLISPIRPRAGSRR